MRQRASFHLVSPDLARPSPAGSSVLLPVPPLLAAPELSGDGGRGGLPVSEAAGALPPAVQGEHVLDRAGSNSCKAL